jgi:hypothetical protein
MRISIMETKNMALQEENHVRCKIAIDKIIELV